jgi:DNA polymerase I
LKRPDLMLIDGKNLLWRNAEVFKDLSIEVDGEEIGTGAIYGMLASLARIHIKYGGATIVAWEGSDNFRYKLYPQYKHRSEPDDDTKLLISDMNKQMLRIKAILRVAGVPQYSAVGCEADDVLGTMAKQAAAKGLDVVIYSGDSDMRQLVDERITIISPGWKGKEAIYDSVLSVETKHGVPPSRLADLKAFAGDTSDGIPGLPGIGAKRAAQLIQEYGDVEEVIKAAQSGKVLPIPERLRAVITDGAETLRLFKKLTRIKCDAGMREIAPKRDPKMLVKYFYAYQFKSLLNPPELASIQALGKSKT